MRAGSCTACGLPVKRHFNARNQMVGCAGAASVIEPVDQGRLFTLKLSHNYHARQATLSAIQRVPAGWTVKIGGQIRGQWHCFATRDAAVQAVNHWYNEQMLTFIEHRKPEPREQ